MAWIRQIIATLVRGAVKYLSLLGFILVFLYQEHTAMSAPPPPLDRPATTRVLFHPRATPHDPAMRFFPMEDGTLIAGKIHPADNKHAPAMLFFHGNGETVQDYDDLARIYTQLGITFIPVDYRGYGESEGQPNGSTLLTDARTLWRLLPEVLKRAGLAPSHMLVMGRSLGSAAALEIAAYGTPRPAGLVIDSGFADTWSLAQRLGLPLPADADEQSNGFLNHRKMAQVDLPCLILHGEEDWIIPVQDGQRLHELCKHPGKQLLLIPNAGHNDLLMVAPQDYFSAVARLINGILKKRF